MSQNFQLVRDMIKEPGLQACRIVDGKFAENKLRRINVKDRSNRARDGKFDARAVRVGRIDRRRLSKHRHWLARLVLDGNTDGSARRYGGL